MLPESEKPIEDRQGNPINTLVSSNGTTGSKPAGRISRAERPDLWENPDNPPYPADPGWKWIWRPPVAGRWSGRHIRSRISPRSAVPIRRHRLFSSCVFRRITDLLFPWPASWDYPGQLRCIREAAIAEDIPRGRIWSWRQGKGNPPLWICEALADYAETRARALLEAAAELRALPRGKDRRGAHGTGGRAPYRLRDEKLHQEALARDRALYLIERPNEAPAPVSTGCRAWVEARLGRKLD